jgi:DNA-directed RNA polymerase specialized sigma24 family protein
VTPRCTLPTSNVAPTSAPTDARAIAHARTGDAGAWALLYERHHRAARRIAGDLTSDPTRADDAVAESFARASSAVEREVGPSEALRPWLASTIRDLLAPDGDRHDDATEWDDDHALAIVAVRSLPERHQAILWHAEIDGTPPHELATIFGIIDTRAVDDTIANARHAFRWAYVELALASTTAGVCTVAIQQLAASLHGALSRSARVRVRRHLEVCHRCASVHAVLADVTSALRCVIGPIGAIGAIGQIGAAPSITPAHGRGRAGPVRDRSAGRDHGFAPLMARAFDGSGLGPRSVGAAAMVIAAALVIVAVSTRSNGPGASGGDAAPIARSAATTPSQTPTSAGRPGAGTTSTDERRTEPSQRVEPSAISESASTSARRDSTMATSSTAAPSSTTLRSPFAPRPSPATRQTEAPAPTTTSGPPAMTPPGVTALPGVTAPPTAAPPTAATTATTAATSPTTLAPVPQTGPTTVVASSALFPGRRGSLAFTVTNPGPATLDDLVVTVEVPSALSVVGVSAVAGTGDTSGTVVDDPVCTTSEARTTCTMGRVAPGAVGTVRLDVTVSPSAGRSAEISLSWTSTVAGAAVPAAGSRIAIAITPTCGTGKLPPAPPESCQP